MPNALMGHCADPCRTEGMVYVSTVQKVQFMFLLYKKYSLYCFYRTKGMVYIPCFYYTKGIVYVSTIQMYSLYFSFLPYKRYGLCFYRTKVWFIGMFLPYKMYGLCFYCTKSIVYVSTVQYVWFIVILYVMIFEIAFTIDYRK